MSFFKLLLFEILASMKSMQIISIWKKYFKPYICANKWLKLNRNIYLKPNKCAWIVSIKNSYLKL